VAVQKRERIKDQMVKTAARLWNVPDNEIETNFDPLVLLMLEANAAELERIGYGISASQNRLVERLADLLVPDKLTGPKPAACVVYAQPAEGKSAIGPMQSFTCTQMQASASGSTEEVAVDYHFSPVGNFALAQAKLQYLFAGSKAFRINERGGKTAIGSISASAASSNHLWMAIAPTATATHLGGVQLFIDARSHSEASNFFYSLSAAKATLNGVPVALRSGYQQPEQFELDPRAIIDSGNDYSKRLERQVAQAYKSRFYCLNEASTVLPADVPTELAADLPDALQKQLKSEQLWYLKIEWQRYLPHDFFDGLTCAINAFPALNRQLNSLDYRTQDWVNIVPLPLNGLFLDLESVTVAGGGQFRVRNAAAAGGPLEEGEALLRSSGIGKTSSKDVREMTGALVEAIRDQSAYFKELSNDFIMSRLQEISQILARLEDRMSLSNDAKDDRTYLLLRPKVAGELVTVQYWSTQGEAAHSVKPGTAVVAHKHQHIVHGQAAIVSAVVGGRNVLGEAEKLTLLRQQLLTSNGSIVTADDVKMLCKQLFGKRLQQVSISKTVQVSPVHNQGFRRCIEVALTLQASAGSAEDAEVAFLCGELSELLTQHSAPTYPYHIVIA
jgi:hypothetical protein